MFKNLAGDTPVEQPRQPCLTPRSDDDQVGCDLARLLGQGGEVLTWSR